MFRVTEWLTVQQVTYLTKPWGECVQKYEKTINFTKYSDPACRIECETQHIVDECSCRLPFMPSKSISYLAENNKK